MRTKQPILGVHFMTYDELCIKYESKVKIKEHSIMRECEELGIEKVKGLYKNGHTWIEKSLTSTEKKCVLAEELGHHFTTSGNILDLRYANNAKQERIAREWGVSKLIPYDKFKMATSIYDGVHEVAEELSVTKDAIITYVKMLERKGIV